MKRMIWPLMLGVFLLTAGAAYAQELRIGYVDVNKVLNDSKAGKRVKGDFEKTVKQRQETLAREQQQLKSLEEAYEKDKLLLSDTQKQAKQKDFEGKLKVFQQSAATAQRELGQKKNEIEQKLLADIQVVVRDIAKEDKVGLVFEKSQRPIYPADAVDLTDKVLKRFDAKSG